MPISTPSAATPRTKESRGRLMSTYTNEPGALGTNVLSVALIGPQEPRRMAVASALAGSQASTAREFPSYPSLDDVPEILEASYDVVIVELDSDPERALDLVEHICSHSSVTVMVYAAQPNSELLVRCMRAGAREFLTQPITPGAIAEALVRASVRRSEAHPSKKNVGKLLVFTGAKGGSGVTTVASNFAVALVQESQRKVALIDLVPLGDAALDLGVTAQFSAVNALQNYNRLDANFLATLLAKHSSGVAVLAAPDRYSPVHPSNEAVKTLMAVSRQGFDYVVVDAGSGAGSVHEALLEAASTIYLVTQVNIPALRNSNRLISQLFKSHGPKFEIVLNRFSPHSLGIDEENITKALTMEASWKIPSDYPTARRAEDTATPLALEDSPISRVIRKMARTACGLPAVPAKKKWLSLFG